MAGSDASAVLKSGDMVLAVNGRPVTCFADVEAAAAAADAGGALGGGEQAAEEVGPELKKRKLLAESSTGGQPTSDRVLLTVCRGGEVMDVSLCPGSENGMGTHRIVHWCGAQLQAPHRAVREHGFLPACSGVFISRWHHGSPSHRYGLYALHFIAEVNGRATPDLDTFVEVGEALTDFARQISSGRIEMMGGGKFCCFGSVP